ncbi:MAG: amidohydrolase family protein, partial [Oscillospiraceae bacterium]|nr:amidohydrolase family protein [Oscillospiraceae bacterium]
DHRCGIVHVQLTRPEQLEAMRTLNLHAYIQSIFLDYDSRIVRERAGTALAQTSYAFHSMKCMGLHVSNGTDCPVEYPHPMRGIQCAITRQPLDGSLPPYRPEEAMTLEEALVSYSAEGAYASFEENTKGKIQPDHLADFVILSQNPFTVSPTQLSSITPLATFLAGKCVYQNGK